MKTEIPDNRTAAPNDDAKLFKLLQGTRGWTFSALNREGFSQTIAKNFVSRYPDLVEIAERRNTKGKFQACIRIRPGVELPTAAPEPSMPMALPVEEEKPVESPVATFTPPPQYSLEVKRLELMGLLEQAPRYSNFLEDVGFSLELIKRIAEEYPNTVSIEAGQLGQRYVWHVSMTLPEAAPELQFALKVQAPEPPAPVLSPEELQRARWRPAAPSMTARRGRTTQSGSIQQRERRPLPM
jgi:hypothetical protein